jgi:protein-L-isoaspartate O-methyltransferase
MGGWGTLRVVRFFFFFSISIFSFIPPFSFLLLADVKIGPYDAIHVGAAADEIPQPLLDQLKAPGRMFIPVEEGYSQYIYQVDKDKDGNVKRLRKEGVMYVPLTDAREFSN